MKTPILRCAMLLLAAGVSAPLVAATLDQSYAPASFSNGYSFLSREGSITRWSGQTFTAGLTGQLAQIDLPIWRDPAYDTGLTLDVFTYNGTSLGSLLGSVTLLSASVPVGRPNGVAFPLPGADPFALSMDLSGSGINVTAGQMYALAASATALYPAGVGGNGIVWLGSPTTGTDNYAGGHEFFTFTNSIGSSSILSTFGASADLGFRTYVTAIPEPEIYAMLSVGLGLIGWVGRRRKLKEGTAA